MKRLSICIPTYMRPIELEECLNNLLMFSDQSFEVIVGDDNSTDNTQDVISKFKDKFKYFKYLKQDENVGFARNMDSIIRNSSREFIFVLNDDDFGIEQGIINCINILSSNNNCSAVGASYIPVQQPTQLIEVDYTNAIATIYPKVIGAKHLINNLSLCDCHPVMRRKTFENGCHYYDRTGMLIPIYFELLKRGDVIFIDKPIYQHRTSEISLTTRMSESWFIDMANADLELCFADSTLGLNKSEIEKCRKGLLDVIYFQAARMALLQKSYYTYWLFVKRYLALNNTDDDFPILLDQSFLKEVTIHRVAQIIRDCKFKKICLLEEHHYLSEIVKEVSALTNDVIYVHAQSAHDCDSLITLNNSRENSLRNHTPIIDLHGIANSLKLSKIEFELEKDFFNIPVSESFSKDSLTLFSQLCNNYFSKDKK
jgi:glycosyltransferase involved in cell wall biosynthesis